MRRLALIEERAEHVGMAHREISEATSTHAESLDAACLEVSDCAICRADVRDEFLHQSLSREKAFSLLKNLRGGNEFLQHAFESKF